MYFRFTLFNSITLFIMALTVVMAWARFRIKFERSWPLLYYAVLIAYWRVFAWSLNSYWLLFGVICGLLLRFEFLGGFALKVVRVGEIVFFAYVFWRCLGMLLLW